MYTKVIGAVGTHDGHCDRKGFERDESEGRRRGQDARLCHRNEQTKNLHLCGSRVSSYDSSLVSYKMPIIVHSVGVFLAIAALGYLRLFLNEKDRNELLESMNKRYGNNQANVSAERSLCF